MNQKSKRLARGLIAACVMSAALSGSAIAALPPIYQRMNEFRAVLAAVQGVVEEIGEVIAIEFIDWDVYQVRSLTCVVVAHIVDIPQTGPLVVGPRQFAVELEKPVCTPVPR